MITVVLLGTSDTLSAERLVVGQPDLTERTRDAYNRGFTLTSCSPLLICKNLQTLYVLEITVTIFLINGKCSVYTGVLFVRVIFLVVKFWGGAQIKGMEIINYFIFL